MNATITMRRGKPPAGSRSMSEFSNCEFSTCLLRACLCSGRRQVGLDEVVVWKGLPGGAGPEHRFAIGGVCLCGARRQGVGCHQHRDLRAGRAVGERVVMRAAEPEWREHGVDVRCRFDHGDPPQQAGTQRAFQWVRAPDLLD